MMMRSAHHVFRPMKRDGSDIDGIAINDTRLTRDLSGLSWQRDRYEGSKCEDACCNVQMLVSDPVSLVWVPLRCPSGERRRAVPSCRMGVIARVPARR